MSIRVCKFGGSSVADAGQMGKVRSIVDSEGERRFVVPSAPGKRGPDDVKITDLLYQTQRAAAAGKTIESLFGQVASRYQEIVRDLDLDCPIDEALANVHDRIRDGAGPDYAASRGEYLSGAVSYTHLTLPTILLV